MQLSVKFKVIAAASALCLTLATLELSACSKATETLPGKDSGFAVLELFTSEGCSSCPPAEQLLAQIQKESQGKPVYILAYHVDYWDRLGWKDRFSDERYSERQRAYSRNFSGQIYTPQLILNGSAEGVGSNERFVRDALAGMIARPAAATLKIEARQQSGKTYIDYEAEDAEPDVQLEIAVVQKHAVSNVMRGENEGRTLTHAQIVRSLSVFNLGKSRKGTESIELPTDFNASDWEIIGLLHHVHTAKIAAASRTNLH